MNKREKTSMFRNEIGDAVSEIKRSFNQYATEMTACGSGYRAPIGKLTKNRADCTLSDREDSRHR